MKIAIIRTEVRDICASTYNNQEIGLGKALCELGHNVTIYNPWHEEKEVQIQEGLTLKNQKFIKVPVTGHIIIKGMKKEFVKENFDVLHCNEENMLSTFYYYVNRSSSKFVIYHGMYKVLNSKNLKIYEWIHNKIFTPIIKRNSIVFTKTTRAKQFLERKGYCNAKVLPVGLDIDRFIEKKLDLDRFGKEVLYIGVLEERRNISFILDLAVRNRNRRFKIIGTGPLLNYVKDRIVSDKLENVEHIEKLPQEELVTHYKKANVLLLPSDYEIFGMVLLEALFFNIPVLSTPTAGAEDIVDETSGVLESLDIDKWTIHLEKMEKERHHFSPSKRYIENYQWSVIAKKYLDTVKSL